MPQHLVIVESPTKAKTIGRFLGSSFIVKSSFGHVRDLPKSKIGVDVAQGFLPHYVIPTKAKTVVTDLKKAAKKADMVYFATDEDREGEAISWHLAQLLGVKPEKAARITFHEITKDAIARALEHPRTIDEKMVDAQQARRILDRLVGYELSPLLWNKIQRGLSAGRVQSVAVRLIVEREREILAFIIEHYFTVDAVFAAKDGSFEAALHTVKGTPLEKMSLRTQAEAAAHVAAMQQEAWKLTRVEMKDSKRSPSAPYTTSTLQQDGNRKLSMSAKQIMMIAQRLYEGTEVPGEGSVGLITYMRTDSVNLAESFVQGARVHIEQAFGKDQVPASPRLYTTKSKGAQEAHEAIRPTDAARTPESLKSVLAPDQWKLYDLIWRRAVASQMIDARLEQTSVDVTGGDYLCRATGSIIKEPGFLRLFPESQKDATLPNLVEGQSVTLTEVHETDHETEPPARYSDASLVKAMEEFGIGRPSTYAPTIATIVDRGYVERIENRRLQPTEIALKVNDLLVEHFPSIVDYQFTAHMEDELDAIADGKEESATVLREFYTPFHETILEKGKTLVKQNADEATDIVCEKCGKPMVKKTGRFGKFLACTGYPECKTTKPLAKDGTPEEPVITEEKCDKCGRPLAIVSGRYGAYLKCTGAPECDGHKPLDKKTGVTCPSCKKGDIVEKKSKRGKLFFACNKYPDCTFALWNKPTGEVCPTCGYLLVFGPKGTIKCSEKTCAYQTTAP